MTADRPPLGIALMIGFCILIPFSDALAKLLGARFEVSQLVLVRFVAQAALLAPVVWLAGRSLRLERDLLGLVVIRTMLHIVGLGFMFLAFRYLPLADAIAIAFVMPFLSLLLGRFILGEEVGPRRLIACAVGFAGTLLVIQPSFADVGYPALLPLVVALSFALFLLITRKITHVTEPLSLQATGGMIAVALLAPLMIGGHFAGIEALTMRMPAGVDWLLFALMVLFGTGAHLVLTWAYRFAPTATLAPMQYLEIPMAALVGWLFFRDFPNGVALVGICITIAAGLYIIARERAVSRSMARANSVPG